MFRNYFKTAWRSIVKNRLFSVLNITGLTVSVGVSILLTTYVIKELSFDKTHHQWEHIYRVNTQFSPEFNSVKSPKLPNSVAPAMLDHIPGVRYATRLIKDDFGATASVTVGDKSFTENSLYLADSALFKIFDFEFIEGNARQAFMNPKSIVISESTRDRLFGKRSVMNELISINNRDTLQVSGVYTDLPETSTLDCNMIYNIMDSWMGQNVHWSNSSYETYCLLDPNADPAQVENQTTALLDQYMKDYRFLTTLFLQPLSEIHLYSTDLDAGYSSRSGNHRTIKFAALLAVLTVIIACINYMNLATARSSKNAKEVGVSKVLGAGKAQIIRRFYTETALVTLISIAIGYAMAILFVPAFETLAGTSLRYSDLLSPFILIMVFVLWIITTLLSGSYPAFYMNRIGPLILMNQAALKHTFANKVRRFLVVFQFAISVILIISIVVISRQMSYIQKKDLGYNPSGIVSISIKSLERREQFMSLINDIKSASATVDAVAVQSLMGENESGKNVYKTSTDEQGLPVKTNSTNGPILKTLDLELLAGTDLPGELTSGDTTCYVLINETVAKFMGFEKPEDAIGKPIVTEMRRSSSIITGVVKNFNYSSLKETIGGYVYYRMNRPQESQRNLLVKFQAQDISAFVNQMEASFKKNVPNGAFDYRFMDDHIYRLYQDERRTANITGVFSALAIMISCLGLLGLASSTAEQRQKEIGIRKVLGASVSGIVALLSKDFVKLVLIAILIASPIAWWAMNSWLDDFAYKIAIQWWLFAVAGLAALTIALLTVSWQAIKAAVANPVDSLRDE